MIWEQLASNIDLITIIIGVQLIFALLVWEEPVGKLITGLSSLILFLRIYLGPIDWVVTMSSVEVGMAIGLGISLLHKMGLRLKGEDI